MLEATKTFQCPCRGSVQIRYTRMQIEMETEPLIYREKKKWWEIELWRLTETRLDLQYFGVYRCASYEVRVGFVLLLILFGLFFGAFQCACVQLIPLTSC